jgi:hypothetical protein
LVSVIFGVGEAGLSKIGMRARAASATRWSVGETLSDAETGSSAWPMILPAPAAMPFAAAATAGTLPARRRTRTIQPAAVVRVRLKV